MNQKTAKLIRKYAELKGVNEKELKSEWNSLNETQKSKKRQSLISELTTKK